MRFAITCGLRGKVEGNGTDYLELFRRDKTPLEKLFTGERITLAPPMGTAPIEPEASIADVVQKGFLARALLKLAWLRASSVTNVDKKVEESFKKEFFAWFKQLGKNGFGTIRDVVIGKMEDYSLL